MLSQLFILSARGDIIVNRDFRSDLVKNTHEIFYREVKLYKGDAPPIFNKDGINFAYIKRSGLYIVGTSRFDMQPSLFLEILARVQKIIKDFLGVLSEESIRKNFVLIYELLDECIDFGMPQLMSSDLVKPYIVNDPVNLKPEPTFQIPKKTFGSFNFFNKTTTSSQSSNRSVKDNKKDNEIFVDIFEKISVLFNSSGYVINSSIEGCVQMKSYLKGNPALKLALNEDLQIGRSGGYSSSVVLDDCNFHNCVNTNEFEASKILRINPPDGEFVAMNYRVTSDFQAPFRVFPFIEEVSNYKLELTLKIKACFPKEVTASYLNVSFPLPSQTANVHNELAKNVQNQKVDVKKNEKTGAQQVEWELKKFMGSTEHVLKTKISLQSNANTYTSRKEIGPIGISFEIPMYNVSNLTIKYLRIEEKEKSYNPYRWVRYVTQSSSYVCRT
ncbi:Mu homology domain [Pseudocohnilembus persalinus]|uniref:Mu homology domain n=1 Tax=Pseudocohnilembus persalinus TaxID=266149 RepID=A0A0V0Q9J0_PSEPJ|nr:Mu homology domain [Pseudocohnilembus persalinus]|eukprot:KRW98870.1 Mu homology domain [Pseudocohnilembus persalinus]